MKEYIKPTALIVLLGDELMQDPGIVSEIGGPQLAPQHGGIDQEDDDATLKNLNKNAWSD